MATGLGSSGTRRALVLALVVVLVAFGIGAWRYQPLRQVGPLDPGSDMTVATVNEIGDAGAHILKYSDGGYVTYAFTIRNTGPVGVTVTGVALPDISERRMLQPVTAGLADGSSADAAEMKTFAPFQLAPGEQQRIIVQARMDNCEYYTERAIETVDTQGVTFRTAGISRTASLALEQPLLVRSPTIQRCPERTLDRAEHRRTEP